MERPKMPRIKRAAQFAPFEALRGLNEALERKRREHIAKQKGLVSDNTQLAGDTNSNGDENN